MTHQARAAPVVSVIDDDDTDLHTIASIVGDADLDCRCFPDVESFLASFSPNQPGCLVLDLRLPGKSGLELLENFPPASVRIPVIVLSGHADVDSVLRAIRAGAGLFLEKPFDSAMLRTAILDCVTADLRTREALAERAGIASRLSALTRREREVVELIVAGNPNKEIAALLERSQKTIEVHRTHIMRKMEAGNVAELVRMFMSAATPPGAKSLKQAESPSRRVHPQPSVGPLDTDRFHALHSREQHRETFQFAGAVPISPGRLV